VTEQSRCARCGHPSWPHCLRTVKVPFSKEHTDSICAECIKIESAFSKEHIDSICAEYIRLGWPNCPAFVPPPPKAEKKEG